jgi:AraC family transcriptional regulator
VKDAFSGIASDRIQRQRGGGPLRLVRLGGLGFRSDPEDSVGISMALAGSYSIAFFSGGRHTVLSPQLGQFGVIAPGYPAHIDVRGECLVLQLSLPIALLRRWWSEDAETGFDPGRLVTLHSLADPDIAAALLAAWRSGPAQGEEPLRVVAMRLLDLARSRPSARPSHRGGLTGRQLARVFDFVDHHLASALDLPAIAAVSGLSPFHFAREFKASTGRSPWEHVIHRRLLRAVALLREGGKPLPELAREVGFSHASHLSRHLVRAVGCSPGDLRRSFGRGGAPREVRAMVPPIRASGAR